MQLLTPAFLGAFPDRVVNVHPSLLPAFPGIAAIEQAIDYGAKVTGVTVHLVDEGVDTGPIIAQRSRRRRRGDDRRGARTRACARSSTRCCPRSSRALAGRRVRRTRAPPRRSSR
jgi:phosphoribosylglycinamide formyltransferase-1